MYIYIYIYTHLYDEPPGPGVVGAPARLPGARGAARLEVCGPRRRGDLGGRRQRRVRRRRRGRPLRGVGGSPNSIDYLKTLRFY